MNHFQNTRSDIFIFRKRAVFHKSQNSAFDFPCPALGLTPGLPLLLSLQLLLSALRLTPFSTVGLVARCKSWIQPYSPQLHWCCCATFLPVLSSGSETSWPIELTAFRNEYVWWVGFSPSFCTKPSEQLQEQHGWHWEKGSTALLSKSPSMGGGHQL